ncbi:MAG: hypothetical protein FWD80_02510, partial [Propionibacteriaceae bacterium]|nr:hypothetical protein [Propionibacteriaceae bacterium]
ASCGDLLSSKGQTPDGRTIDMTGAYTMSSPGIGDDGLTILWLNRNAKCIAQSFSVVVRVAGDKLLPDTSQMSGPAIGCLYFDGPDYSWVMDMFANTMLVTILDSQTIRIAAVDPNKPTYVDFQWG